MILYGRRLYRALTRHVAETSSHADDPRLRGRTYAVPFEEVWQAALTLTRNRLRGWRLRSADDLAGIINAVSKSRLLGSIHDVKIRVSLDKNAQTRIDARSASRTSRADLGANARRLVRFFRALDKMLEQQRRTAGTAGPRP
ncbi:MAG: DUF1499 domain-containing protein [Gemmatimonadetes bacterium]|nr:DUF1499 domain-containing protein [Gemmatimonadota bacterium]